MKIHWNRASRKAILTILALAVTAAAALPIFAQSYGIIGSVLSTDIKAYINGYEIPAYNVDGSMVIVGSDLRNYGFNVVYDNNSRTSSITLNPNSPAFEPLPCDNSSFRAIGTKVMDVYSTDIKVLVNGSPVRSYNVDNKMAFAFSELKIFGDYGYDNATRTTRLTLSGEAPKPVRKTGALLTVTPSGWGKQLDQSFVFDDLEITLGSSCTWTQVSNRFSEYNGKAAIRMPVTVKNLADTSYSLNIFYVHTYGSSGTELDDVSAYFDDSVQWAGDLRPGASYTKYLYFLYDGNGIYTVELHEFFGDDIVVEFYVDKE